MSPAASGVGRFFLTKLLLYSYTDFVINGGCGEVVNTLDCGSSMRGFDPHQPPHEFRIS